MRINRLLASVALVLGLLPGSAGAGKTYDVLDLPAVESPLAERSLVFSLARAGERIVATGIRGHILYSDDQGQSWTQADTVPVRSSLLDASFPTPQRGWVVGHEAVILHTEDGGRTWVKQTDGRDLPKTGLAYYQQMLERQPDDSRVQLLVDEMQLAMDSGADRPFFRVFMRSETTGFAAGAYGFLFRTTDAGASWVPIMELMDLEQYVHIFDAVQLPGPAPSVTLNGETAVADTVGVGEMGTVLMLDPQTGRWRPHDFPYDGSMFTIVVARDGSLVTGGLRGLVFRSTDRAASWQEVAKPPGAAVVASALLADGRLVLGAQDGSLLLSGDDGASFEAVPVDGAQPLSDLIEGRPGELVLAGAGGLRLFALPPAAR